MRTAIRELSRPFVLALLTLIVGLVSAWAAFTNQRVAAQDERIASIESEIAVVNAKLEMVISLQRETLAEIRAHVDRELRAR